MGNCKFSIFTGSAVKYKRGYKVWCYPMERDYVIKKDWKERSSNIFILTDKTV
jgi:hypothetical protein